MKQAEDNLMNNNYFLHYYSKNKASKYLVIKHKAKGVPQIKSADILQKCA
jgi:hypothetical protein